MGILENLSLLAAARSGDVEKLQVSFAMRPNTIGAQMHVSDKRA